MKILIAGATGAIGQALLRQLYGRGDVVMGMVRSAAAAQSLSALGAEPVIADAFDTSAVAEALRRVRPDVVINELTALPKHYTPGDMQAAAEHDRKVRVAGNINLLAGMQAAGVRRYLLQSSALWYEPGPTLAKEDAHFAFEASPGIAAGTRTYAELESAAFNTGGVEVVALRYGFFYGPGTWYTKDGDIGDQVRQRQVPIVGAGRGVSSYVHIDDAAAATVAAFHCAPGVYNISDDDPSEQRIWLPAFARYADAPEPPHVTEEQALQSVGADVVYYATRLRGASNAKAKRELDFHPRPLEWLHTTKAGED